MHKAKQDEYEDVYYFNNEEDEQELFNEVLPAMQNTVSQEYSLDSRS